MAAFHLVTADDFTGEIYIADVTNPNSGACQTLCEIIDKYEPLYMQKVWGYPLYNEVVTAINLDPNNVDQKYIDLVDGVDYTNSQGILTHYEGIRVGIRRYIYYWYGRTEFSQTAGLGVQVIPNYENGAVTSHATKMSTMYNQSMVYAQQSQIYLNEHSTDFPNWESFYGYGYYYPKDWFIRNLPPPFPQSQYYFGCMNKFGI